MEIVYDSIWFNHINCSSSLIRVWSSSCASSQPSLTCYGKSVSLSLPSCFPVQPPPTQYSIHTVPPAVSVFTTIGGPSAICCLNNCVLRHFIQRDRVFTIIGGQLSQQWLVAAFYTKRAQTTLPRMASILHTVAILPLTSDVIVISK